MALEDKKGQLGKSAGPGISREKAPVSPKADAFGKSGYIGPDAARGLLKNSKSLIYEKYKLGGTEVDQLSRKITSEKRFSSFTDKRDIEKYEREGRKEINKITNLDEKTRAKIKLEKELKTLKGVFLEKK